MDRERVEDRRIGGVDALDGDVAEGGRADARDGAERDTDADVVGDVGVERCERSSI
jgi:hypothetical protein